VYNPNRIDNTPTDLFGIGLMDNNLQTIIEGSLTLPGIVPNLAPGFFNINF